LTDKQATSDGLSTIGGRASTCVSKDQNLKLAQSRRKAPCCQDELTNREFTNELQITDELRITVDEGPNAMAVETGRETTQVNLFAGRGGNHSLTEPGAVATGGHHSTAPWVIE
jgi:hypothetical protein